MYRLATMHSVTDRWTNRQIERIERRHYHANSRLIYYDRLKTKHVFIIVKFLSELKTIQCEVN